MSYMIGLVGECGAGKSTFINFLKEMIVGSVSRIGFSDILMETLCLWGIESTRGNLQKLAVVMNNSYGYGILSQAVFLKASQDESDIVIIDGIRWKSDVEMLKRFPSNLLIYITAGPKIRFERMRSRNEKIGENKKTFRQFLKEEKAPNEILIPRIGASDAEFQFKNIGSLDDFKEKIEEFLDNNSGCMGSCFKKKSGRNNNGQNY